MLTAVLWDIGITTVVQMMELGQRKVKKLAEGGTAVYRRAGICIQGI